MTITQRIYKILKGGLPIKVGMVGKTRLIKIHVRNIGSGRTIRIVMGQGGGINI